MWRTVIVTKGEKLTIRDNWLVVYSDNREQQVPIGNQYSVYAKTVRNFDDAKKHCRYLQSAVPPEGSVRVMTVTEKQYASMELPVGERLKSENLLDSRDIIEL